jgi:hypothetical protein
MHGEDCGLCRRAAVFRFVRLLSFFLPQSSPDPDLAVSSDEKFHDYRVLANGLAAVLARCPADLVRRDLQASAEALRLLRRQFKSAFAQPSLPAALLNDLAHEVAHRADANTRAAALRCLRRSVEARRLQMATPEASPAQ